MAGIVAVGDQTRPVGEPLLHLRPRDRRRDHLDPSRCADEEDHDRPPPIAVPAVALQGRRHRRYLGWAPGRHDRRLADRHRKGPLPWRGLRDIARSDERDLLRSVVAEMVDDGVAHYDGKNYSLDR